MALWFRRTRRLGSKDRRRVSEIAHGILRHQALLGRVVGLSLSQVDDRALVEAWARLIEGDRFPELCSQGALADYATSLSLPQGIAGEWLDALGPTQAGQLGAVLATRAPLYLRVDATWGSPSNGVRRLEADGIIAVHAPGRWALRVEGRANIVGSGAFREGAVEVQDLSSQDFVAAIDAAHRLGGASVLDLCAGAGGKSLAMAALGARVQAWDRRARALDVLRRRASRAGHDIRVLDRDFAEGGERYDIVVVDAPCSGSGRLMREPALRLGLEPDRYLDTQARLLSDGATRVRPGGLLAYATCSLLARENQHPILAGFTLVDSALRWPHRQPGDGFGWRLWRRG